MYQSNVEIRTVDISVTNYLAGYNDRERFEACCRQSRNYGRLWCCPPFDFDVEVTMRKYGMCG